MKLNMILCVTEDYLLGDADPKGNGLLWHVKEELQYFKEHTIGQVVVFGKRTADCVPVELMRKNRDVEILRSGMKIEDIMAKYEGTNKDIYIAGGGKIYEYFLTHYTMDNIYLSVLKKDVPVSAAERPIYLNHSLLLGYKRELVQEFNEFIAYRLFKNN